MIRAGNCWVVAVTAALLLAVPTTAQAVTLRAPSATQTVDGKVFVSWAMPSISFQADSLTVWGENYSGTYSNDHGLGIANQSANFANALPSGIVTAGTEAVVIACEAVGVHQWQQSSWKDPDGAGAFFPTWAKAKGTIDGVVFHDTWINGNGGAALSKGGYDRSSGTTGTGALSNRGGAYSLVVAHRSGSGWRLATFTGGALTGADNAAVSKRGTGTASDVTLSELDLSASGLGQVYEGTPAGSPSAATFSAVGGWQGKKGYAVCSAVEASAVIAAVESQSPGDLVARARSGIPTATVAPPLPADWSTGGMEPSINSVDDARSFFRNQWDSAVAGQEVWRGWFWWMDMLEEDY